MKSPMTSENNFIRMAGAETRFEGTKVWLGCRPTEYSDIFSRNSPGMGREMAVHL